MKPNYVRFCYSPKTDHVSIAHNKESHPAFVRSHGDLASEVDDSKATHGYAIRHPGGWRVLDYEFNPLDDKYIHRVVGEALKNVH